VKCLPFNSKITYPLDKEGGKLMNRLTQLFIYILILVILAASACTLPLDIPSISKETSNESPPGKTGTVPLSSDIEHSGTADLSGDPDKPPEAADVGLRATLEMPGQLTSGQSVNLKFELTNQSERPLYVLKWYTPLEGIAGEIFRVTRDGEAVPYQGILASRSVPTADSYVLLEPGERVSAEVDLGTSFDFSKSGTYRIEFLSPRISHVAYAPEGMAKTMDALGPLSIPSNPVLVEISGD
jgi:hypothetical protein